MARSGVYEIRNKINTYRYIGSSVDLRSRFREHKSLLNRSCHCNPHLQNAWNKHGKESFEFHALLYCDKESVLVYEQLLIDKFMPEYNICPVAGNTLGYKHTEETKRKMSIASSNCSDETRQKLSKAAKGKKRKPFTEEHKRNISKGGLARAKITEETKKNMSLAWSRFWDTAAGEELREKRSNRMVGNNINLGRKLTEEHKAKIAPWGRKVSEETKEKMRIAATGREFSEETKRKISVGLRNYHKRMGEA